MHVYQIPISKHPLLEDLYRLLLTKTTDNTLRSRVDIQGDVWKDIENYPPIQSHPTREDGATWKGLRIREIKSSVREIVSRYDSDGYSIIREAWYFPESGGYGWHTNCSHPGPRIYIVHTEGHSFVKTLSGTFVDVSAHANLFFINDKQKPSWHCIGALANRWSIGIQPSEELLKDILR
jgi:hypothetical protein